jgi:hypothetical protein
MMNYTIVNDNEPDLKFFGELIGNAEGDSHTVEGKPFCGHSLDLYKTSAGKFICSRMEVNMWEGERDTFKTFVCETEAEVIEFFGQSWTAKIVYEEAKIENVRIVE